MRLQRSTAKWNMRDNLRRKTCMAKTHNGIEENQPTNRYLEWLNNMEPIQRIKTLQGGGGGEPSLWSLPAFKNEAPVEGIHLEDPCVAVTPVI